MPPIDSIFELLEGLPDRLTRKLGFEPPKPPGLLYNLYRSAYHFTGGALVGLATCWNAWVCFGAGHILAGLIIYNEYRDLRDGGSPLKSLIDVTVWLAGFLLVYMLFFGHYLPFIGRIR